MSQSTHRRTFGPGELERALERFDWMVEEVRDEVHRSEVTELQGVLDDRRGRTAAKERALAILGLMGTAEAEATLCWFDSRRAHRRVRLLHRLARRECARRRGSSTAAGPRARRHEKVA